MGRLNLMDRFFYNPIFSNQHERKVAKISIDRPEPYETCNKSTKSQVHFLVRHSTLQNHFKMLGFFTNL